MATILLQAAGAALGGILGPVGAAIGTAAGALAGYIVDRGILNGLQTIEGPRLTGARPFTAEEGAAIPRVYGAARMGGLLIWATRFEESRTTTRQGFKGGPRVTEYSYFANVAFALCEGEIAGIRRIWADGKELDRTQVEIRIHTGTETQAPDPLIEAKQGAGNAPAYRGTAYAVFERFPLADYGNRIPQLQFEVLRPVGDFHKRVRAVALIPGATEYGLSPTLVTQQAQPGETGALNRHGLAGPSNLVAALDELQMLCPNLDHVALVAAWFGTDLRAGSCQIRPMVTNNTAIGFSSEWLVSGVTRASAVVVSQSGGGPAYGGSPSDKSVMEAIAEIKARGLKVTLYPFIMMDVPAGNALPDPYGASAQAAYPWRGRITCHPGPGQSGSADKTAAARTQIQTFCGTAMAGDFSPGPATVTFSGTPGEWSYRRFVLHFTHLAVAAGGVDTFILGSELRGLTTLRDGANAFPFVEALSTLATDVRGIVGPATKLTYAADWSEYFGHQPADGSGDVFFHLDPLWAHPQIAAVGIDNYMPLSDWRDADYAGGNPDGFATPYDAAGLAASIAGGEGYDWYYASDAARLSRTRTPITDGLGKPWVFRYKDLVSWWSNAHRNRIGGVEAGAATAWVPQSKPFWLTELGCPAVDKGPNQPNVFPDPKSSESAAPYFSSGGRSDAAQRRFLEAHQRHWDPAAPGFVPGGNPVSTLSGARMLDIERTYVWAWDARPFPAFPLRTDTWSDGGNWQLGHWLNGRLETVGGGDLIGAILKDFGIVEVDTAGVEGMVQGYVLQDPSTARAALEPLMALFGIVARDEPDALLFAMEGAGVAADVTDMALADQPVLEIVRAPDHDLPREAVLGTRDALLEYQATAPMSRRIGAAGSRQQRLDFPGTLDTGLGQALLDDWMARAWTEREQVTFHVAPADIDLDAGTTIRLPERSSAEFLVTDVEQGLLRKITAKQIARTPPTPWRAVARPQAGPSPTILAGTPDVHLLDLPMAIETTAPESRFRVAAWQKPWRSQAVYASATTSGYALRTRVSTPAIVGRLTVPLAASSVLGRVDRTGSVTVRLSSGELTGVGRLDLLNGANLVAIRAASGAWEIVQFQDAEETAPDLWRLTRLLRGQLGTDDAMRAGAPAGAPLVVLDGAVVPAGLQAGEIGLTRNWRIGPTGFDVTAQNFVDVAATGGLRAQLPLSPVHVRARRDGSDLRLSWVRRGRINADDWQQADVALAEATEEYRLEIAPVGGATIRTATSGTPSWTYTAAAIAADFGMLPGALDLTVRQKSQAVGWGVPSTARLTIY